MDKQLFEQSIEQIKPTEEQRSRMLAGILEATPTEAAPTESPAPVRQSVRLRRSLTVLLPVACCLCLALVAVPMLRDGSQLEVIPQEADTASDEALIQTAGLIDDDESATIDTVSGAVPEPAEEREAQPVDESRRSYLPEPAALSLPSTPAEQSDTAGAPNEVAPQSTVTAGVPNEAAVDDDLTSGSSDGSPADRLQVAAEQDFASVNGNARSSEPPTVLADYLTALGISAHLSVIRIEDYLGETELAALRDGERDRLLTALAAARYLAAADRQLTAELIADVSSGRGYRLVLVSESGVSSALWIVPDQGVLLIEGNLYSLPDGFAAEFGEFLP